MEEHLVQALISVSHITQLLQREMFYSQMIKNKNLELKSRGLMESKSREGFKIGIWVLGVISNRVKQIDSIKSLLHLKEMDLEQLSKRKSDIHMWEMFQGKLLSLQPPGFTEIQRPNRKVTTKLWKAYTPESKNDLAKPFRAKLDLVHITPKIKLSRPQKHMVRHQRLNLQECNLPSPNNHCPAWWWILPKMLQMINNNYNT